VFLNLGQAMKVENMLKIKEEFDYKSLSKKLEVQLDKVIAENERQLKAFDDDVERINRQAQNRISEVEKNFAEALEKEKLKCQMEYMESVKKLEEKLISNQRNHENGKRNGEVNGVVTASEFTRLKESLENEMKLRKSAEEEVSKVKSQSTLKTRSGVPIV
jgi:Fe2+ transport system protein B